MLNFEIKEGDQNETEKLGDSLRKEAEGSYGVLEDERLQILGKFGVSAPEDEAQLPTGNWVSIDFWQRLGDSQFLVSLERARHSFRLRIQNPKAAEFENLSII